MIFKISEYKRIGIFNVEVLYKTKKISKNATAFQTF